MSMRYAAGWKRALALVNVATGSRRAPGVQIRSPVSAVGPRHAAGLFVEWENTALIEPRGRQSGTVYGPYAHWRTGDHRPDGLLIAPAWHAAASRSRARAEDLAPSIAARLGVALDDIDGR
jgi:hypothetical protein